MASRQRQILGYSLHGLAALLPLGLGLSAASCDGKAPVEFGRTPAGDGATVRFDLGHTPLPDIPLPSDTATWPDPTSRTGLRLNASLIAPTAIERDARERFDRLEGWGTFAPITVSFDLAQVGGEPREAAQAAIDLANIKARHHRDDYDFANDAIYVINLATGVPVPLDVGNGNFEFTLKRLDRYWPNDTRASERNLVFDTRDESSRGVISRDAFLPELDTDFDGNLDIPNLDEPFACGEPDPVCDDPRNADYESDTCLELRRDRDRCITDHLVTFYERETDTLIVRPLVPLDEMTKYAVVLTDRLVDANGNAVRSPFNAVFHASQRPQAERVMRALDDATHLAYFGDIAGTGLEHVAFTWSFTTQPTVSDMKLLRDGLFGSGPFADFEDKYPAQLELRRAVGKTADLEEGATDPAAWEQDPQCLDKVDNLYIVRVDEIRDTLELAVSELFGSGNGPDTQALLRSFDAIDYLAIGTYRTPYLLQGGPDSIDPKAAFDLDFTTGGGEVRDDVVQFFMAVPKETAQFKQPFNVNLYGHGYTGNFLEPILYAGNLAQHGLATVGINAMGHGLDLGDETTELLAKGLFSGGCAGPLYDSLLSTRGRDLDGNGRIDSGGDFWSSYLFHTRDGVRQSVLDHIQLVRILRAFGTDDGRAFCRTADSGWANKPTDQCDVNGDGEAEVFGDFDGNGVADIGGREAKYGTWGESLGGILSGIHGAVDAYVTSASPGSGGGGLTDIGVRSFQGGVVEAVLLRMWGPLIVTVPSEERAACTGSFSDPADCTTCKAGEISLRWVMPALNDTGEVEIQCLEPESIRDTTVLIYNSENDELRCASVEDDLRLRVGLPSSVGDRVTLSFYDGAHQVEDYASCRPTFNGQDEPRLVVDKWGKGRFPTTTPDPTQASTCAGTSCNYFQGTFFNEGAELTAPAEGYGQIRQTPSLRRFLQLAQMALDPGDPVSFAPYYAIKEMTDPFGEPIESHAVLTINTIGDMNVPLNSGIAFARASGALPFLRPEQAVLYPEYADYATPTALFQALGGKTPNQDLIDNHVIEGITALARHPASPACETSANADVDGTFTDYEGNELSCYPAGCVADPDVCYGGSFCDPTADRCLPNPLGKRRCDEALFDADDLDEGAHLYFEQAAPVPHRLVRYTASARESSVDEVWQPRINGAPGGQDDAWQPAAGKRVTGLLDAYVVPEGVHTFVNGNPCQAFDHGTYLTNLVGRFFQTDGTDVYYLSHPATHHCLETGGEACGYINP
jgi:hypothetical protein